MMASAASKDASATAQGQGNVSPKPLADQGGAVPNGTPVPKEYQSLIDAVFKAYTTRSPQELDQLISEHYKEDVKFNDPIASMIGQKDVKLQFYSLQKVFSVVTVEQQAATIKAQKHGLLEVEVPNMQRYTFARGGWLSKHLLPEKVDSHIMTVLTIDEASGRVQRHSDLWESKPLPPKFVRTIVATIANAVMRLLGWERQFRMAAHTQQ